MKSYFYIILSAFCLSFVGVLVKLISPDIHFLTIGFYRMFFGFLFLLFTVPFFDKKVFKVTKKDIKEYFIIGLFYATSLTLFPTALQFTTIQSAVLLSSIYPFFVLIFAYFLLNERITITKIITLIIAFIGLSIINPLNSGGHALGNILVLIDAAIYAMLIIAMKKEIRNHSIGDVMWFLFFGALILSPVPFIFGFGNLSKLFLVSILGFISTGLAYLSYNLGLKDLEAEISSIIMIIVNPLISIILGFFIINEVLDFRTIFGGLVLILSGVYLQTHSRDLRIK